jgi:predicted DNA-binding protein with PD1-like motif
MGAFSDVTLGCFDWTRKQYTPHRVAEKVEVLALIGDMRSMASGSSCMPT